MLLIMKASLHELLYPQMNRLTIFINGFLFRKCLANL
jgi:hypothetical protein